MAWQAWKAHYRRAPVSGGERERADAGETKAPPTPESTDTPTAPTETPLPDDFDRVDLLRAAGFGTYESLEDVTAERLEAIKGIGPKTAREILAAVAAHVAAESE